MPSAGRMDRYCRWCESHYTTPQSWYWRNHHCSPECRRAEIDSEIEKRRRRCEYCGESFIPRRYQINQGEGRYCSISCSSKSNERTKEWLENQSKGIRKAMDDGRLVHKSGPDNPLWTGGQKAAARRRIESGKARRYTRKYRKENPHKVREFSQRRNGKKFGKLPYGTIPRLLKFQKEKCAICWESLKGGYHVDHIYPIAKGGKHEPHNIQLLCPTCNVRKWIKDPIEFMQERGRLL